MKPLYSHAPILASFRSKTKGRPERARALRRNICNAQSREKPRGRGNPAGSDTRAAGEVTGTSVQMLSRDAAALTGIHEGDCGRVNFLS